MKSYSGCGGSSIRYLNTPSARLKSAGLAPGCAGAIGPTHPLVIVPFAAVVTASLPGMKPAMNGFPLLLGPL